jgi:hypothetical protein
MKYLAAIIAFVPVVVTSSAHADPTETSAAPTASASTLACIQASEQAQSLKRAGDLVGSKAQIARCSAAECPAVMRKECFVWMDEIERMQPSVVVTAHEGKHDVSEGNVSIDGKEIVGALNGVAIDLNPGPHKLVCTMGAKTSSVNVVVALGERFRIIDCAFEAEMPVGARVEAPVLPRRTPWFALGLTGAGVVAGAVALGFHASAIAKRDSVRDSGCAPSCSSDDRTTINTRETVAGAALGIGVAAVATGGILLLSHYALRTNSPANTGWLTPIRF